MERKTLTIKRPSTENVAQSAEPVIQRRRKQVVVNMQRKPHKPTKTAPIQPTKKAGTPPATKQKAVVIPVEKKVIPPTPPKQHLPLDEAIANL
ncbi:conjugal transfer protein, partial [Providencia rettgeri]